MIVSKSKAEKHLRRRLKGSKKSYYVLSEDGRKNLGGPYNLANAKKRLTQVEYFKSVKNNPSFPIGARVAFMPTAFEMYYFKAKGIEPGDQGIVVDRAPGNGEDPDFDTPVQWDKGIACMVNSRALRLCNPVDWEAIRRLKAAIQSRKSTQLPAVRPKPQQIDVIRIPRGFESAWDIPLPRSGTSLVAKGESEKLIIGHKPVKKAVTDLPAETQQKIDEAIRSIDDLPEMQRFRKWIVENPPREPSFLGRIGENVLTSGLTALGLRGLGILRNPPEGVLNDETVARELVEHHIKDIQEGLEKGLKEYAVYSYEDLVGLFARMTPRLYNKFSSEYIDRLRGLRDLIKRQPI